MPGVALTKRHPKGRIVDLGAGTDPDFRANETADKLAHPGVDHQFDLRDGWPFSDDSVDGLIANHCLEHIPHRDIPHVFDEAARVLDGGWFEVSVPVGCDFDADPSHESRWTWRTPDLYCDPETPWVETPAFCVEDKRLHVWMIQPLEALTPAVRFAAKRWPHEAWYELPGATGELITLYKPQQ